MRKEVAFAIIAGITIGLVAAFGVWRATKMIKRVSPITAKKETPAPKNSDVITISDLKDFDVVTENLVIKGFAAPNTDLIISTSEDDFYTKSNKDGEFEKEIELPSGLSEIKIYNALTQADLKLNLVYSTEVEQGSVAYVGTITDISAGSIQIKSNKGGILQISANVDTTFINVLKKNIEVKESDLAIGDYIVAMGVVKSNKVLESKRILITSPLVESKIEIQKITIEKLTKTMINDITLPKKWNGPNIKELEVGQEIYIVGTKTDNKFDLRSIFVIE